MFLEAVFEGDPSTVSSTYYDSTPENRRMIKLQRKMAFFTNSGRKIRMEVGTTLMCHLMEQISYTPESAAAPSEYEKPCSRVPLTLAVLNGDT